MAKGLGQIGFIEGINSSDSFFQTAINGIEDFEARYSWMRNVDGSYTNMGKYLGGVANTLGAMLPSMLLTYVTGGSGAALTTSSLATLLQVEPLLQAEHYL